MNRFFLIFILINTLGLIGTAQQRGLPRRVENPQTIRLAGGARVEFRSFKAPSLERESHYSVFLPPGYDNSTRDYPVVYFLHGMWNDHTSWTVKRYGNIPQQLEALMLDKAVPPCIVVHPDGENSFYTDYLDGSSRFEELIYLDLRSEIESTFRAKQDRKSRSIGGVSMGAYGALKIAMKKPDLYSVVAGVSPIVFTGKDPSALILASNSRMARYFASALKPVYGMPFDPVHWQENSLEDLAKTADLEGLKIYFAYGTADRYNNAFPMEAGVRALNRILDERAVDHRFRVFQDGPHGWRLVVEHFKEVVQFLVQDFN